MSYLGVVNSYSSDPGIGVVEFSNPKIHPRGIISHQLNERVIAHYELKGHTHVVNDLKSHMTHMHHVKANRLDKQVAHIQSQSQGVLPDGQIVKIYTANNKKKLRAELEREGKKPVRDTSVNEAYDGAAQTYKLLKDVYHVKSIDGKGFPLIGTVHFGRNFANAYWDGDEMTYGDGDGKVFTRFTKCIDVCGHEMFHGVTQERSGTATTMDGSPTGIDYEKQAGGINEALSDIGGIMVKQRFMGHTAETSDWQIGAGLIKSKNGQEFALRSMKEPGTGFVNHPQLGTDTQVKNFGEYMQRAEFEEVDPHDSSGVVNKAFYEASIKMGGLTWEKAGRIFFETYPYLVFDETFKGIADKTAATAEHIFGKNSAEHSAILHGWTSVGVL